MTVFNVRKPHPLHPYGKSHNKPIFLMEMQLITLFEQKEFGIKMSYGKEPMALDFHLSKNTWEVQMFLACSSYLTQRLTTEVKQLGKVKHVLKFLFSDRLANTTIFCYNDDHQNKDHGLWMW